MLQVTTFTVRFYKELYRIAFYEGLCSIMVNILIVESILVLVKCQQQLVFEGIASYGINEDTFQNRFVTSVWLVF